MFFYVILIFPGKRTLCGKMKPAVQSYFRTIWIFFQHNPFPLPFSKAHMRNAKPWRLKSLSQFLHQVRFQFDSHDVVIGGHKQL